MEPSQLRTTVLDIVNQTRANPSQAADNFYKTLSPQYKD